MSAQIVWMRSGSLHEHRHLRGGLGELVPVEVAEAAGELLERLVDRLLVDVQLEQPRLEVERHRGAVADRVLEAVAAHVAGLVLLGAEGVEGVAVGAVDRRAGEAEQERVRQRLAHLAAEVALLRAVRLVDHRDDVAAVVEDAVGLAELEDRGDDDLAHVLRQQPLQLAAAVGLDEVRHVGGVEGARDLAVEVDPVDHDQHGRILERRVQPQLARGEEHQQRLARALEVPDQALLRVAGDDALDDLVRRPRTAGSGR